ncbi:MAG: DUF3109 family protein [Bacteroidia bacterium]
MIVIKNTLVSEDIFKEEFVCNLYACKGACCIEGDAGAPLDKEEIIKIEHNFIGIKPFLNPKHLKTIEENGFYEEDDEGEYVTTCQKTGECNFAVKDKNGILSCGIELAFASGKSDFVKPLSCHLYPIRLSKVGDYIALNYHRWHICHAACSFGKKQKVSVFEFLKQPLIRAFGEDWYNEGLEVSFALKK